MSSTAAPRPIPIPGPGDCLRRPNARHTRCTNCDNTPPTIHSPGHDTGYFCPGCCPYCSPSYAAWRAARILRAMR